MPALPAILLMGPTGAGKTALAAGLVERLPLEIVSVDSAMVFRGMDIGTAKPGPELLARAPHHLIDLIDPSESYSAARFVADANRVMDEIRARSRVPILVGGTMLYFRALQSGLAKLPPADAAIRRGIEQRARQLGWPALHAELQRLDPRAAGRILPGDQQRIQRALEVIELTGRPISAQQQQDLRGGVRDADLRLVLAPADRAGMGPRLAQRFHCMMSDGLLDEVRRLHRRRDLHAGLPAMRLIGYRQLWAHLEGAAGLEEAIERAIIATRQLARRQLTWLRAEPGAEWFDSMAPALINRLSARIHGWLAAC
ncbi:MAG: tRNA (adenosine(37)-N6)-dimethylallyltransferase MiaA [Steroidobacteraceae bacterium]